MAVTQNLARLNDGLLSRCAVSVETLDGVCSFKTLDPKDYLDLDWAPFLLQQVTVTAQVPDDLQAALRRATSGDDEVNPAYREAIDTIWEHPVASLEPVHVVSVAASLQALARFNPITPRAVAKTLQRLQGEGRQVPDHALDYLQMHFEALRDFYRGAVERRLGVITWWD